MLLAAFEAERESTLKNKAVAMCTQKGFTFILLPSNEC